MPKYKINIDGKFVTKVVPEEFVSTLLSQYPNAELISETPPTENFQNGDAETDASAPQQIAPASSGDFVLEDTSSESVEQEEVEDAFTPYYFTFEEIKGLPEDEVVSMYYDRLASVGITVDTTSTYKDLDAIQLTKGAEEDLGFSDLLLSANPVTKARALRKGLLRGMDADEFFGGDNITEVGEDVTDEQLKLNIQKLNNFIKQNADLNYTEKARKKVGGIC